MQIDDTDAGGGTYVAMHATASVVYLGVGYNKGNDVYGSIGEAMIYKRALNIAEIKYNYIATKWRYM